MNLDPEQGIQMVEIGETIVLWFNCNKGQKPLGMWKYIQDRRGATKIPATKWVCGQTVAIQPYLLNPKTSKGDSPLQVWIKQEANLYTSV